MERVQLYVHLSTMVISPYNITEEITNQNNYYVIVTNVIYYIIKREIYNYKNIHIRYIVTNIFFKN